MLRPRRGRFLGSLEEEVQINGEGSQKIIILEDLRPRIDPQGYVVQELRYVGNLYPPNFNIKVNDLITRNARSEDNPRGASSGQYQVLTVENIAVIKGKQQLQLRDRDRGVR